MAKRNNFWKKCKGFFAVRRISAIAKKGKNDDFIRNKIEARMEAGRR